MNLKHLAKDAGRILAENSPQILTALGVVGTVGTAILAGKASWKAKEVIEDDIEANERDVEGLSYHRTYAQDARLVWKLYIPAVTTGVMTVACIVAANRVQARRMAAILGAYGVLSGDFDEYRAKMLETLGFKKSDELNAADAKDKLNKAVVTTPLDGSKSWFLDLNSMRPFPSTMETVKEAQNNLNYMLNNSADCTMNDFWEQLGLEPTAIGDLLGWDSGDKIEINFTPVLMDEGGAATAFRFVKNPRPKGRK